MLPEVKPSAGVFGEAARQPAARPAGWDDRLTAAQTEADETDRLTAMSVRTSSAPIDSRVCVQKKI